MMHYAMSYFIINKGTPLIEEVINLLDPHTYDRQQECILTPGQKSSL